MESERAQHRQNRESSQQYRSENTRNYQQIPRAHRRNETNDSYNDRFNEGRHIPGKATHSEIVNGLTDDYMNVKFPHQESRSPDLTGEKFRFQHFEKDPRSLEQPRQQHTTEEYSKKNQLTQNLEEKMAPRYFHRSIYNTENEFKPLAGQNLAYLESRRSEAAKQMAAGDAANRKAANEINGYQTYTSGLGCTPKLSEPQGVPSYQMTNKETNIVYGEEGNGEPITALNMEVVDSGPKNSKLLQTDQRKHSKIVGEAIQLQKTRSIVVELIDKALEKLKPKMMEVKSSETSFAESDDSITPSRMKQLKSSCFKKIEDELMLLKTLDRFSTDSE